MLRKEFLIYSLWAPILGKFVCLSINEGSLKLLYLLLRLLDVKFGLVPDTIDVALV